MIWCLLLGILVILMSFSKKLHLLVRDFTDLFTKSLALILAYGST